jgi:hypothetical protein
MGGSESAGTVQLEGLDFLGLDFLGELGGLG